jgi:hypothetical protein
MGNLLEIQPTRLSFAAAVCHSGKPVPVQRNAVSVWRVGADGFTGRWVQAGRRFHRLLAEVEA